MEITEWVDEVEDITDPKCMEKLQIYLESLQEKDEEFMELLVSKAYKMHISWVQPWYQQSTRLTRPLQYIEEAEHQFLNESFSKAERQQIEENWKKFRKIYDVPNTPICLARWRSTRGKRGLNSVEEQVRRFVMAFLAQGLERNLYQVYLYFVSHYGAPVKGSFSESEEKIMQICLYHKPNKVVPYLAAILGREPRGISKRLKILSQGNPVKKKLKWSLPLATKFVKSLMKHSKKILPNLKYARFHSSVWLKVQEDMDHNYSYLERFWYRFLHVQLFVKYDVKLKKLRKKILKRLSNSSYEVWSDIRWKNILQEFPDGFTHQFLYYSVYSLFLKFSDNLATAPLQNVIEFGYKVLKESKNKKRLKTLTLNDEGNLEIVHYNDKLP